MFLLFPMLGLLAALSSARGAPPSFPRLFSRGSGMTAPRSAAGIALVPELKGKAVLITGASTGIGAAAALAFGQNGAQVAVNFNASRGPGRGSGRRHSRERRRGDAVQGDVTLPETAAEITARTV